MQAAADLHLERVDARGRDLRLGLGRAGLARCLGELPVGFRLPNADAPRRAPGRASGPASSSVRSEDSKE